MLMGPNQCARELRRLFDGQRQAAERLLDLLETERESLRRAESEQLEQLAISKSKLIEELQTLEAQQRQLLAQLAFPNDAASALDRALDWCDVDGSLRKHHVDTMQRVIECKRDNQRNGVLVRHRLGYLRRALEILRNAHADALVYGPDGRTEQDGQSRLLAEG